MPRSSHIGDLIFDFEIEKTACRLSKETGARKREQSSTMSLGMNLIVDLLKSSSVQVIVSKRKLLWQITIEP